MNANKKSNQAYSSAELDQLIELTTPTRWFLWVGILGLIAITFSWIFFGEISQKVVIKGIIHQPGKNSIIYSETTGIVNDIIEKKVISNNAIVGFYSFETDKLKCFFKTSNFKELASKREVFLSDIVRDQIKRGIKYSISSVVNYKSLGTPLDLKQ